MSRGGAGHKAKRVTGGRGGRQGPSPAFHCALCQLQVNSETQLKQVGEVRLGLGLEPGEGVRGRAGEGRILKRAGRAKQSGLEERGQQAN